MTDSTTVRVMRSQTTQKTDLVSSQFISDSVCSRRLHGSSGSSALLSVFPLLQRTNPGARLTLQDRLAISVNLQLHDNNLQRGTTYEGAVGKGSLKKEQQGCIFHKLHLVNTITTCTDHKNVSNRKCQHRDK